MQKWEYRRAYVSVATLGSPDATQRAAQKWYELLNALGQEGWELVTENYYHGGGAVGYDGTTKRPIEQ